MVTAKHSLIYLVIIRVFLAYRNCFVANKAKDYLMIRKKKKKKKRTNHINVVSLCLYNHLCEYKAKARLGAKRKQTILSLSRGTDVFIYSSVGANSRAVVAPTRSRNTCSGNVVHIRRCSAWSDTYRDSSIDARELCYSIKVYYLCELHARSIRRSDLLSYRYTLKRTIFDKALYLRYFVLTLLEIMVKAYEGALLLADICLLFVKMLYCILEGIYRVIVSQEEKNVAGEIVLITGAGHGIGRELALKYATLGATVVCLDLNPQGNQETINEIKKLGATTTHAYQCDVANREQVMKIAEKIKAEVGDVTILLNNAGIMPCHSFLETTADEIRRIFDINVLAHFWLLQAFLPTMVAKNHGHVVALSSIAGVVGLCNLVPYCSSKFAVRGLMESMHEELRQLHPESTGNVKFTTIFPYMVDTGLCKNTRIRFPSLMSMVSPAEAAAHIVSAQRRNVDELSIPNYWLFINSTLRNFPNKVSMLLVDFLNSGVESDL